MKWQLNIATGSHPRFCPSFQESWAEDTESVSRTEWSSVTSTSQVGTAIAQRFVVSATLVGELARGRARSCESRLVGEVSVGGRSVSKQTSLNVNGKRVGVSSVLVSGLCWFSCGLLVGGLLPVVCFFLRSAAPFFQKKGRRPRNRPTFPQDLRIPQIGNVQRTETCSGIYSRGESPRQNAERVSHGNNDSVFWYCVLWSLFSWKPVLLYTASLFLLVVLFAVVDVEASHFTCCRGSRVCFNSVHVVEATLLPAVAAQANSGRHVYFGIYLADHSSFQSCRGAEALGRATVRAAHTPDTGCKTGAVHEWLRVMEDVFVPPADRWPGPLDSLLSK